MQLGLAEPNENTDCSLLSNKFSKQFWKNLIISLMIKKNCLNFQSNSMYIVDCRLVSMTFISRNTCAEMSQLKEELVLKEVF